MTDHKQALAGLFAQALKRRYPSQEQGEAQREDYIRAAMEGDPVVYLEAAWDWWRNSPEGRFLPSPGQLIRWAKDTWDFEREPYCSLERALEGDIPGVEVLIARMGADLAKEAKEAIKPSHERAWLRANLDHRLYICAKSRMQLRGTPPYNPSETKGLNLPEWRLVAVALGTPAARQEGLLLGEAQDLAQQKRLK
jgi:hypothetical protein